MKCRVRVKECYCVFFSRGFIVYRGMPQLAVCFVMEMMHFATQTVRWGHENSTLGTFRLTLTLI